MMNAYRLRKDEVQYELRIRNVSAEGSANELKTLLSQSLSTKMPIVDKIVEELNVEQELARCEEKLSDLDALVEEFDGKPRDNEYFRIVSRLHHLLARIERIPVQEDSEELFIAQRFKLQTRGKELMDSFVGPVSSLASKFDTQDNFRGEKEIKKNDQATELPGTSETATQIQPMDAGLDDNTTGKTSGREEMVGPTQDANGNRVDDQQQSHRGGKSVPVYKWGLTFDHESGQSIGAFLDRVEELRRARGVTELELYESAVDLFRGSTLIWYRSTRTRIKTWKELCKELKAVFQSPDYEFVLQQEITNRIQGEQEPIDLYLAAMEGLYGRLSTKVSEQSKICQLRHNLNPYLQDKLCLCNFNSVEELRTMARQAEAGRLRTSLQRPPMRNAVLMEPDLAWQGPSRGRYGHPAGRIAAMQAKEFNQPRLRCWNCLTVGHTFKKCKEDRKRFCFGCGEKDVIKAKCRNCSPKNV